MSTMLRDLLSENIVITDSSDPKRRFDWHTHVSQIQPKGKFAFNRDGLETLWDLYCDTVIEIEDPNLGLSEVPNSHGPILVDIDLKIVHPEGTSFDDNFYSREQVLETIGVYQSVLRRVVESCSDEQLICFVLERPPYRPNPDSDVVKNGFHAHFPNLFLSQEDQRVHVIPRVRDELSSLETFNNFVEDSGSVVDDVSDKVWLMYGSKKEGTPAPYRLTEIYNHAREKISLEEALKTHHIFDAREESISMKSRYTYYLPRVLSILPGHRKVQSIKKGIDCYVATRSASNTKKTNRPSKGPHKVNNPSAHEVRDGLRIARKLVPMLSQFRADDRDEWMTIGWALYNIGDGCDEALDLWLQHSQRSDKYDETICIDNWNRMSKGNITLGTLRYYAEMDNPKMFAEFKKENLQHHRKNALNGSHFDIARILYEEYASQFVCASIKNKMWYQFVDHHWKQIDEGTFLFNKISTRVVEEFIEDGKGYISELATDEENVKDRVINSKVERVQKLIAKLKDHSFKKNVMNEAAHVFYDERFKDKLDQDPNLIAFDNGVYDLKNLIFRAGCPEDFISKKLTIPYREYNSSDDEVQEVLQCLEKLFPDKSLRNYFLDIYSDIFMGGNSKKIFVVWTGTGNNGKSVMQHMLEDMLGPLSVKMPTTVFSGPKVKAGQANPEMVRLAPPVRSATFEEPDGDESFNIGILKAVTGGDKIGVRDLYQAGKEIRDLKPMFMPTLICNKLPRMRHADDAYWDRVKVIPYESKFIRPGNPCPESYEEQLREKQFPMDMHFSSKIPDLLAPFAWLLLEHRKNPTRQEEPDKVREATVMYRKQNDDFRKFDDEKIIRDPVAELTMDELFNTFRFWFSDSYPNRRADLPDRDTIKQYFIGFWGESTWNRNRFVGFRIRQLEDDCEDNQSFEVASEDLVASDKLVESDELVAPAI